MHLVEFAITNYRSINDSGPVAVGKLTSLVGRNESGKTNLLLALQALNPVGGLTALSPIKDFPRHRRLSECTDETRVLKTTWELEAKEQQELAALFPRAAGVTRVEIGRYYKPTHWVHFLGLKPLEFSASAVDGQLQRIIPVARAAAEKLVDDSVKNQALAAIAKFAQDLAPAGKPVSWASRATSEAVAFRQALTATGITLPDREDGSLRELEGLAAEIATDAPAWRAARDWAAKKLPIFIYLDEYPQLSGHQNIEEYLGRKNAQPSQITAADKNFEKMCKVADLDPAELERLRGVDDHETRNQLANRAGAVVTSELRRLWKDRQLKVRFSPDARHLDTFVSDPNSAYDVEVNLDERSRGLKWFFSFYITFAADTKSGSAENAILLLDEPGLHLHALSQGDLLRHLATDFSNQIVYTTHSPFMVPTDNLDAVRTVNISQDSGTMVTNSPTGDARTLFPLQMALGYSLSQSLFLGPSNLVVEGVTDYWILSSVSEYLQGEGKGGLPKGLTVTPAGGAQKVRYMVALLTAERLQVLVLLDEEKQARGTREELVRSKLIRDDNVIFASDGFTDEIRPREADIEDLLDPDVYDALVRESYRAELKGKRLVLNDKIPRVVKRYEAAFADSNMEFLKTRPARLLLTKMATDPTAIMTAGTMERFRRLFERIGHAHARNEGRGAEPFR
jgi:energy-coupling factor transporter ATP-binding protein EcfA2